MSRSVLRITLFLVIIIAVSSACSLFTPTPNDTQLKSTSVAQTFSVLGTQAVLPPGAFQTAIHQPRGPSSEAVLPQVSGTSTVVVAQASSGTGLVVHDALCYMNARKGGVISSIKAGERVTVQGRGGTNGTWWSIINPRYNIPCWLEPDALQADGILAPLILEGTVPLKSGTPTPGGGR